MSSVNIEQLRREYMDGRLSYAEAVLALQSWGMDAKDAEAHLSEWDGYAGEPAE